MKIKISLVILCATLFFACSCDDCKNGVDGKDGVDGTKEDKGIMVKVARCQKSEMN